MRASTGGEAGHLRAEVLRRRAAEEELRKLAHRLVRMQDSERSAIAKELHDEMGQQLTCLCLALDRVRTSGNPVERSQLEEMRATAGRVLEQVRALSKALSPPLGTLGLGPALTSMIEEFSQRTGIRVSYDRMEAVEKVPEELSLALYRIVQEALTNVARHAGVPSASVDISRRESLLRAEVRDEGRGFDPQASSGSLGLAGMRERARSHGGTLEVRSSPGRGTRVIAEFPLAAGRRRQ
jgi:signal transduction histidine kinase